MKTENDIMKPRRMKRKKSRFRLLFAAAVGLLILCGIFIWWDNHHFTVTYYSVASPKAGAAIRIVDLSDLHNASFGADNEKLVSQIRELQPDIITITGDMVTSGREDISVVVGLCGRLTEIAPVFYSFGNHENEMVYGSDVTPEFLESQAVLTGMEEYGTLDFDKIVPTDSRLPDALRGLGVTILNNGGVTVEVKGQSVDLIGVDNLSGTFFPYSAAVVGRALAASPENLKVILAHRPSVAEALTYMDFEYELLLCGHKHGGIVRIPGLGGMFCEGSFWPWFTGEGKEAGMLPGPQGTVVVSRGLGNSSLLPRINNTPELVVIDIEKGDEGS